MSSSVVLFALFERVFQSFARQGMMRHLEARLLRVEPGCVQVALAYGDKMAQQQGGFHGGAMGTLADIAAQVVHVDINGKESVCAVMQQILVPVPQRY